MSTSRCWCCGREADLWPGRAGEPGWCTACKYGGDDDCYCGSVKGGTLTTVTLDVDMNARVNPHTLFAMIPAGYSPMTGDRVQVKDAAEALVTQAVVVKVDWARNMVDVIPAWGDWGEA